MIYDDDNDDNDDSDDDNDNGDDNNDNHCDEFNRINPSIHQPISMSSGHEFMIFHVLVVWSKYRTSFNNQRDVAGGGAAALWRDISFWWVWIIQVGLCWN